MRRALLIAGLTPLLLAAQAAPPPPLCQATGDLDGDGIREVARVERDGAVVITDREGRERLRAKLPSGGPLLTARLAFVRVEDHVVAYAQAPLGRGRQAEAVLGAQGPIYLGRTGPVGDGERSERLRVDGAGVVRWQTSPGFSRCDGNDLLFPERWDFAQRRFRPVLVDVPTGRPLAASRRPPAGLDTAPLGLFRFEAESTDGGSERRADRLGAPRELDDGQAATSWSAGAGGAARGAWATARTQVPEARVRAIKVLGGEAAPRSLRLILGPSSDQHYTVKLASGATWVALPTPEPTACLSVVVDEPGPRQNRLAEVAIYTDMDGKEGLSRLVEEVAELRPGADGAAHLLAGRGQEAARAIAAALPTSQGEGRRRLLQSLVAIGAPEAAPALGRALETAEAADRPMLVEALVKLGPAGAAEAARIYGDETQTAQARIDAAAVLGRTEADDAGTRALLDGAGRGEPPVRQATMDALSRRFAAAHEPLKTALLAGGPEERIGDLARALGMAARRGPVPPDAGAALLTTWKKTAPSRFALRLRLVRAMGDLADVNLLPALSEAAGDAEPVLRQAAVRAAAAIHGGQALVQRAAKDADPGVRRVAFTTLGGGGQAVELGVAALGHDGWPMVRQAAAEGLGSACSSAQATGALVRAVSGQGKSMRGADAADEVRRASLASLGRCAGVPTATFATILTERRQPPSVRELAATLVARRGGPEAGRALAKALDDVLSDPAADERSAGLAVACTRALAQAGDRSEPVLKALGEAANEPMSAQVRAAAMTTIGELCPAGAGEALRKGAEDNDRSVAAAAKAGLASCHQ